VNAPVVHGGLSDAEHATYADRGIALVDLSASLNPYGPHPRVTRAARFAAIDRYPEADSRRLREAYAAHSSLSADRVLAGNGSSELIYLAARAAATAAGTGMVIGPTFGEYSRAIRAAGMTVETWTAHAPAFELCVDEIVTRIRQLRPDIVFVCNPNNPTGRLFGQAEIDEIGTSVRATGGWIVIDEAYMDFANPGRSPIAPAPGEIILRSLTKLHAVPGLRLGFALAEPSVIGAMAALQAPWSVSAPAQAAGLQALKEEAFAAKSVQRIARSRARLVRSLQSAGFEVNDSAGNFLLVRVTGGAVFRRRLMERGFVVRDCASFGLPEHVRVSIPRNADLRRLVSAMIGASEGVDT